jgi:transposase-like protein
MARYSEDQKSEALAVLASNGGNVSATRRQLDWSEVPAHKTIRRWERRADSPQHDEDRKVGESADQKKKTLADRLEESAWTMVGVMDDEDKLREARINQLTTGFGTLVDKMRLLREEATEINENRNADEHRRALDQRLERLRARGNGPERN